MMIQGFDAAKRKSPLTTSHESGKQTIHEIEAEKGKKENEQFKIILRNANGELTTILEEILLETRSNPRIMHRTKSQHYADFIEHHYKKPGTLPIFESYALHLFGELNRPIREELLGKYQSHNSSN